MGNIKNKGKFKGCLQRAAMPFFIILFCVIIALAIALPTLLKLGSLSDYATMIKELAEPVKDSDMSKNPIGIQDNLDMQDEVNAFVECKELDEHGNPKSLFDITGAFIYDNIKRNNINIIGSSLELDNRTLGAFVNSLIGAGWIEGFYDKGDARKYLSVLDITTFQTQNDITRLCVIMKANLDFFVDEETSSKEGLDDIDDNLYITYTTEFRGNEILSATMAFNKISDKSNKLLLQTLFSTTDEQEIFNNVSSVMAEVLNQLKKIETEWGMHYSFVQEKLVIVP